ncbi:MAG: zinc-binding alcohol dehydrogenase [Anaerolineae bacterium]
MERQTLWFQAPYEIVVRAEPLPAVGSAQVLVQTLFSAISAGTELLFYRGQAPAGMAVDAVLPGLAGQIHYPLQYGYASVGRVIEAGAAVPPGWLGRLVFAFQPHASHFLAAPADLIPLPDDIAPEHAALLPNMETAVNFVMDGAPSIGERVLVLGQGIVGLLTTALLARMPLACLLTLDRFSPRREASRGLGATAAFDPSDAAQVQQARDLLGPDDADLTYELSGNPAAVNLAIELTGFAGRIVIGSWYGQKQAPVNLGGSFHRSRIRLMSSQVSTLAPERMGRWTKARRMDVAWEMLRRIPVAPLITHRFCFADAAQAYALLDQAPEQALQVILTF